MNRLALGLALFFICGPLRAGDPTDKSVPPGGKPDQFSRSILEQQQGRPEGSANPMQEGVPVQQLATGTYAPPPGSPERAAIMDGIRGPIVAKLHQPVIFKVGLLRVRDGWAFLKAEPRRADGGQIDYRKTKFAEAYAAGAFDPSVLALLRQNGARWEIVDFTFGATDLPYGDWWKKYRAPKSIFDYAEP
jgi:hypothetical protein